MAVLCPARPSRDLNCGQELHDAGFTAELAVRALVLAVRALFLAERALVLAVQALVLSSTNAGPGSIGVLVLAARYSLSINFY